VSAISPSILESRMRGFEAQRRVLDALLRLAKGLRIVPALHVCSMCG